VPTPSAFPTPSGALSKDAAIAAAIAAAPPSSTAVTAIGANVTVDPFAHSSTGPLVWVVTLQGEFALPSCRPDRDFDLEPLDRSEPPCLYMDWNGLRAVLDLFSGELIGWDQP
jgi:hypothetical protein